MALKQIAADIPPQLAAADELLSRYGRWAKDRRRLHRCGSAEGRYVIPPNDDDRLPRENPLHPTVAMACQRSLAALPQPYRVVLAILYIPRPQPAETQLRWLRIPPQLAQERHRRGLEMWWNRYRLGVDNPQDVWQDTRT